MKKLVFMLLVLLISCSCVNAQTLEQTKKAQVERALAGVHGEKIKTAVKKYAEMYKIEETLILAVIQTESSFNPLAKSKCSAKGLMQLKDVTFKARKVGNNIWDIDQNIHAGVRHLRGLNDRYKGDNYHMLAAYLLGGGGLDKYKGKIPPVAKKYVDRVYYHKSIIETMEGL